MLWFHSFGSTSFGRKPFGRLTFDRRSKRANLSSCQPIHRHILVFTQATNITCCRYRQQWRFEEMGKFLLKSHRSAKSLDSNHVCEQTLNEPREGDKAIR